MLDDTRFENRSLLPQLPALPAPERPVRPPAPPEPGPGGSRLVAALGAAALLALLWTGLTGGDAEAWLFGVPAVLAGAAIVWRAAARPGWRLSPLGALHFAGWFAVQAVRGAVDVAGRAFDPRLPVAPGYARHPLTLPPGAPRLVMANAITLLPGTLTAELHGDHLIVHLLDRTADLSAELAPLEARVRALFALPATEPQEPTQ